MLGTIGSASPTDEGGVGGWTVVDEDVAVEPIVVAVDAVDGGGTVVVDPTGDVPPGRVLVVREADA